MVTFMTINDYLPQFQASLATMYDDRAIQTILGELIHYKTFDTYTVEEVLQRLRQNEPYQYIAGKAYFYDFELAVNAHTLIPRPETEELVHWILGNNTQKEPVILDIGTGSGCIALALAKHIPAAKVFAMDVSEQALEIVHINAKNLELSVECIQMDVLSCEKLPANYDIIVSNPPYIPENEKSLMHANVLQYEPHTALFVEDNEPLIFYQKIAILASQALKPSGMLYFECNEYNAKRVQEDLEARQFSQIELKKDMQDKDRMIRARYL